MNSSSKKRRSLRLPNAAFVVLIDAPSHSDVLLEPEDISLGGFRVTLHDEPEVGEVIVCSIDIMNKVFECCSMTVARVEENGGDPPSWTAGMSIEIPENIRADFEAAMKMAFPDVERGGQLV